MGSLVRPTTHVAKEPLFGVGSAVRSGLPINVLCDIMMCLDDHSLVECSLVCKQWYFIVSEILASRHHDDDEGSDSDSDGTHAEGEMDTVSDEEEADITGIVIDNGMDTFKVGFAGQDVPAYSVPVWQALELSQRLRNHADLDDAYSYLQSDDDEVWNGLEKAWQKLFSRLKVKAEDHPVVITIPMLAPAWVKPRLMKVLFEKLQVPALYIAPSPLLTAYSYGTFTALVVDIGARAAQVVPIVDGTILDPFVQRVDYLSGREMDEQMLSYIHSQIAHYPRSLLPFNERLRLASRMKDELALVAQNYDAALQDKSLTREYKHTLEKHSYGVISLTLHQELINCGEMLFQPATILNCSNFIGIHQLIAQVIRACPVDLRPLLMGNIILSGGVTAMPGFYERLTTELQQEFHGGGIKHLNVRAHPRRKFAAWEGGSILSSNPAFQQKWLFKWEYELGERSKEEKSRI